MESLMLLRTYEAHHEQKDCNCCLGIAILKAGILFLTRHGFGIEGD